jgi:predicted transcriptional regulator
MNQDNSEMAAGIINEPGTGSEIGSGVSFSFGATAEGPSAYDIFRAAIGLVDTAIQHGMTPEAAVKMLPDVSGALAEIYGVTLGPIISASPEAVTSKFEQGAVPVNESVTDDYLVSLIDGRQYKSLKRHLTGHGLTPETYREKFGLPPNYPMVAAGYARQRSDLAKTMGLGKKREPAPVAVVPPVAVAPARRRAKAA